MAGLALIFMVISDPAVALRENFNLGPTPHSAHDDLVSLLGTGGARLLCEPFRTSRVVEQKRWQP